MSKSSLSHGHFQVANTNLRIIMVDAQDRMMLMRLVVACPAELYQFQADGSLHFDLQGCLECGTCRLLCGEEAIARWRYPQADCGIEFRFG